MLFAWQATIQDDRGNVVVSPSVTVYRADGVTEAEIFDANGDPIANPMIGTESGFVQFWVPVGDYVIEGSFGGEKTNRWNWSAGSVRVVRGAAEFFALTSVDEGVRYSSQDGLAWDTLENGSGDMVHPITGVGLAWVDLPAYTLEYFGLVHEEEPVTDQTAAVQKMFDYLGGLVAANVAGLAKVGVSAPISVPASHIAARGLTLFGLSTWGVTNFAVVAEAVDGGSLTGVTFDGNLSAFGGMYPEVAMSGPRGFLIDAGSEGYHYVECLAKNMNSNGFTSLAGGGADTSNNTGFIRCISDRCGVPFAQEIKTVAASASVAKLGPQGVVYDNCRAVGGNYGIYLAGGTCNVIGGYYESKRVNALLMYCGDAAWNTTPASYNIIGAIFHHTGVESDAPAVFSHGIAASSALATYGQQPECVYNINACRFSHAAGGIVWTAEEGPHISGSGNTFSGGLKQIQHRATTLAAGGAYRPGRIALDATKFTGWGNGAGSGGGAYAVGGARPILLNSPEFINPNSDYAECIVLEAGSDVVVNDPAFGSQNAAKQPRYGVFAIGTPTISRFKMTGARDLGLTGGLSSLAAAMMPAVDFSSSTPPHAFDRRAYTLGPAAPSVGTWTRGAFAHNSSPAAAGGKILIGWICTAAGTPGTWDPIYATTS